MNALPAKLGWQDERALTRRTASVWVFLYILAGMCGCLFNLFQAGPGDVRKFLIYLVCANVAVLGIKLMGSRSMLPAGFLVLLLGVGDLSLPELLFVASTAAIAGELQKESGRLHPMGLLFALSAVNIGMASAQLAYRLAFDLPGGALFPVPILASAFVLLFNYGLARTLWTGGAIPALAVYRNECRPLLPWFVAAAYVVYLIHAASAQSGVHAALLALPLLFALDRGYRAWSAEREGYAAELALLHRRTLETLSVVINARDHSAPQHLRRVQFFATAVGEELGLSRTELNDLHVATLVYNIGQLGVPDHILLKPGTLTQEEWEKVKTHPVTGSEMLSRMNFPPGVRAIVQTHHEKWNGTGYPDGLVGDQIPAGARILAAVDCLDALASARPFREAIPIGEAMEKVSAEKGKSFDPRVVSVLEQRYQELERKAWDEARHNVAESVPAAGPNDLGKLAARLLVEAGTQANSIVDPIVSARQETQLLQTLAGDVAQNLRFEEIAAAAQKCLAQVMRFDSLVLYVRRDNQIHPVAALGRSAHRFMRDPIPITHGLSGRAARECVAVLNGDPAQERSYVQDPSMRHPLLSALAMPLEMRGSAIGVMALYQTARDAFTRDHLRLLKSVSGHVAVAVEGALKYQDAENLAGTDHLTGIANARSLALHLDRELARASRDKSSIGVLVCDLNGFKQVNDRFGHLKGNEVLQHVARGLRATCRSSDYFARMGGDEFVVIVPGMKEDLCESYVHRLEAVAIDAGWSVCGEECLSVSVGIAIYPTDGKDSESLLARADKRMYQSKEMHKGNRKLAI